MGTRADFYIGSGPYIQYICSIALDGYPLNEHDNGIPKSILCARSEEDYKRAILRNYHDKLMTEWPWPWEDSKTTDFSYTFVGDEVLISSWGRVWIPVKSIIHMYHDQMSEIFNDDRPQMEGWPLMRKSNVLWSNKECLDSSEK